MNNGYGVFFPDCKFADDAALTLMNGRYVMENDDVFRQYCTFCDNYGYHTDDPKAKAEFVGWFSDEYCGYGMPGLIARLINDLDFDGADYFYGEEDGFLGVIATVPVDDEEKQRMPTQNEVKNLLSHFLEPLLTEPAKFGWHDLDD